MDDRIRFHFLSRQITSTRGGYNNSRESRRTAPLVLRHTNKISKYEINDNQKSALCSLIYNIGQGAFDRSKCKKAIERGDWVEAHRQWDWVTANGRVLPGLVIRRQKEKQLFFEGLL